MGKQSFQDQVFCELEGTGQNLPCWVPVVGGGRANWTESNTILSWAHGQTQQDAPALPSGVCPRRGGNEEIYKSDLR